MVTGVSLKEREGRDCVFVTYHKPLGILRHKAEKKSCNFCLTLLLDVKIWLVFVYSKRDWVQLSESMCAPGYIEHYLVSGVFIRAWCMLRHSSSRSTLPFKGKAIESEKYRCFKWYFVAPSCREIQLPTYLKKITIRKEWFSKYFPLKCVTVNKYSLWIYRSMARQSALMAFGVSLVFSVVCDLTHHYILRQGHLLYDFSPYWWNILLTCPVLSCDITNPCNVYYAEYRHKANLSKDGAETFLWVCIMH